MYVKKRMIFVSKKALMRYDIDIMTYDGDGGVYENAEVRK